MTPTQAYKSSTTSHRPQNEIMKLLWSHIYIYIYIYTYIHTYIHTHTHTTSNTVNLGPCISQRELNQKFIKKLVVISMSQYQNDTTVSTEHE